MLNFFRKIRRQLADENKFQRYFRYAFGEVLLIVLGILLALQLQNWNEKRKQEARFKATLEQLYTTLNYDAEKFKRDTITLKDHIQLIDYLLYYPDSIEDNRLPYIFFGLKFNIDPYLSESIYHAQQLDYNPDNSKQKEIAKEIINYTKTIANYKYTTDERLDNAVIDINIALPKAVFNNVNGNWDYSDSSYYSNSDIINLHNLVRSHSFRAILKTERTYKIWNWSNAYNWNLNAVSIRKLIKAYFPEVKELYKDVGIIGSSTKGAWEKSTFLTLTDAENNIWEIDLYLKVGSVKFRCRDSWAQNWGSREFPIGNGSQDGPDIPISEAGNYHIIFKPVTGEYQFIKIDNR